MGDNGRSEVLVGSIRGGDIGQSCVGTVDLRNEHAACFPLFLSSFSSKCDFDVCCSVL